MLKRKQYKELSDRILEPRDKIQVISGPRQVGKSTMVKQVLAETTIPHLSVSADGIDKENTRWIGEIWESARAKMQINKLREYLLVIDEVHKINNWSEEVKKQWDADTRNDINLKVVLLGSSRLLLKDGLTESLTGRYELIRMPHWSYIEMQKAFGLSVEQYIYYGGYPGGAKLISNEIRWRRYIKDSIIAPAIAKDILMTKVIYKPELMKQLFELGCTYSSEEISLTKILGQLQDAGNVTTLANYLTTLAESQLLCGLQKYAYDNARKYNSVPKIMTYNTALLSALSGVTFEKAYTTPKVWGRWAESAVGAHILNAADEYDYKVYYWRDKNDEVDFIIEHYGQCAAIEVKSGRRTMNEGLSVFKNKFQPKLSLIVGSGGMPFDEFLNCDLGALF
ncbi:MAG: ATP-binding protein [Paludibacteraceae bacterium]|jgi:predicted AAA+ superfamily ATPase|nr:ATP-binding protein [Paludibacteraceae bacterium]MBO5862663.1 ATP-binding protein [Paludibacteraceae bacterium]